MAKHSLYLVTYDRGTYHTGKVKPYHWSYFIQINLSGGKNAGIEHQLRGMPGNFYYPGPEDVDLSTIDPSAFKQQLEIGEVEDAKLDRTHQILKEIQIDPVESSGWNCQNWSLEGFGKLQEEGFTYDWLTKEAVKNWLKEVE
ncbi:hypothetical protein QBC46DRAFT_288348 [Diplogelasinospora grovesii]|uniref:Uncharacterized protein n=1 Tax=Diplogelasinospora grovesii TaxID=303347 RepID=A0AAN6NAV8_9PEZI|nr:hypothetical protein QBC46DRAFT_288348 [Diplogelasinospora grovesii]